MALLFTVNRLPSPLDGTTSRQGSNVGTVSSLLWVDMSLLHHVALPSGVPPAVGCRMPVRRQEMTYWEVAAVWGRCSCHICAPTLSTPRCIATLGLT